MSAGRFLRRLRASTGLLIAGFVCLTSFHPTVVRAEALTASPCNSGASNPPACNAVAQSILFTPDPDAPGTGVDPQSPEAQKPIAGFYRAGSDHRKDGEAVGW
jgi:hypothetical protein